MTTANETDFIVTNHGSIILFQPLTPAAEQWIEDNVSEDRQYFGSALAVEARYAGDLAQGIQDAGLVIA